MIQELRQQSSLATVAQTDPIVLCASDDNYVKPLAVALHSAVTHLQAGRHLHVVLMDGGISESSWSGLRETLLDLPISIHVIRPNKQELSDLGVSHHITHTAYFRLLAAKLLPEAIDKVIYLDSDVLVQADLTELWELELGTHYCLAAVDIACPFVDAYEARAAAADSDCSNVRSTLQNFDRAIPYLAAISPIPNWRQLGLDGSAPYFNSGVMVLNLARWREDAVDQRLLHCLRSNSAYVWCWDQYALNVVFAGQWGELPGQWNQGAHVFEYPDPLYGPISPDDFAAMRDQPSLIHFTTEFKPWEYRPFHPLRERFFEQLDQTAWAGWRPTKPKFSLKRWWDLTAVYWIRAFVINYRKCRLALSRSQPRPSKPRPPATVDG